MSPGQETLPATPCPLLFPFRYSFALSDLPSSSHTSLRPYQPLLLFPPLFVVTLHDQLITPLPLAHRHGSPQLRIKKLGRNCVIFNPLLFLAPLQRVLNSAYTHTLQALGLSTSWCPRLMHRSKCVGRGNVRGADSRWWSLHGLFPPSPPPSHPPVPVLSGPAERSRPPPTPEREPPPLARGPGSPSPLSAPSSVLARPPPPFLPT